MIASYRGLSSNRFLSELQTVVDLHSKILDIPGSFFFIFFFLHFYAKFGQMVG